MAERESWYLAAYDVRDPRRLQRVHRILSGTAIPTQYSVFLFEGTRSRAEDIFKQTSAIAQLPEDDLRIYRLRRQGHVHLGLMRPPDGIQLLGTEHGPYPCLS